MDPTFFHFFAAKFASLGINSFFLTFQQFNNEKEKEVSQKKNFFEYMRTRNANSCTCVWRIWTRNSPQVSPQNQNKSSAHAQQHFSRKSALNNFFEKSKNKNGFPGDLSGSANLK